MGHQGHHAWASLPLAPILKEAQLHCYPFELTPGCLAFGSHCTLINTLASSISLRRRVATMVASPLPSSLPQYRFSQFHQMLPFRDFHFPAVELLQGAPAAWLPALVTRPRAGAAVKLLWCLPLHTSGWSQIIIRDPCHCPPHYLLCLRIERERLGSWVEGRCTEFHFKWPRIIYPCGFLELSGTCSHWSQALGMDVVICHIYVVIADVLSWGNY